MKTEQNDFSSDVMKELHALKVSKGFWSSLDRLVYKDEEEFLENPGLPMEERVSLVHRLNTVNRRSGYHGIFLRELENLFEAFPARLKPLNRPVRILDIGVGGGGLLERIHQWSVKRKIPVELYGVDVDAAFLDKTRELMASRGIHVKLLHANGKNLDLLEDHGVDFSVSSYVVHHVRSLGKLRTFFSEIYRVSRLGWLVVDMERRFWGPPFVWATGYLFGASQPLVWDGVKSMRRAYTAEEINKVLEFLMIEGKQQGMKARSHSMFPYWILRGGKSEFSDTRIP